MNRKKIIAVVVIVSIYVSGLLSGGLLRMLVFKTHFDGPPGRPFHSRIFNGIEKRVNGRILSRLSSGLNLSDEQRGSLKTILDRRVPELEKLRCSFRNEMKNMKASMDSDIRKILTQDQVLKFDELCSKPDIFMKGKHGVEHEEGRAGRPGGKSESRE